MNAVKWFGVFVIAAFCAACAQPPGREPGAATHRAPASDKSAALDKAAAADADKPARPATDNRPARAAESESPHLTSPELRSSLQSSIEGTGFFRRQVQKDGADFELIVRQVRLDKPQHGLSMTVELEAAWSLVRVQDRKTVFQRPIVSSFTTSTSDSLTASTRLQMAVTGAVQENVSAGLRALNEAKH